jgi:hypothetical protein
MERAKKTGCKEHVVKLFEKQKDGGGKEFYPCVIISQGLGNLEDRNYYTAEAIETGAPLYEGAQCYLDHPTEKEDQERPGRSVKDLAGHYEDVQVKETNGLKEMHAKLYPVKDEVVTNRIDHSVKYKKKYPEKDFMALSINGDGEGVSMDYEEFLKEVQPSAQEMSKIEKIKGQSVNVITKLTEAFSADLVTAAGARGRLGENEKQQKTNKEKLMSLIESFRKLLLGIEKDDSKLREEAVKGMLQAQDEGADGDSDDKKKEEEAASKEADSMAKHLLLAKKELKKEDGESDEAYEVKCMKQAMKASKEEKAKEAADEKEKSEGKDSGDSKDEKPEDKKEAAPDKKDGKDDGDGKDHPDKAQDIALIKKMMGELKKEIEELKKGKAEAEEKHKEAQESAAKANIKLKSKERAELVDKVLRESGLPRYITNELRPVIESCKTEKDMKEMTVKLSEAVTKEVEAQFMGVTNTGFVERAADSTGDTTDDLFLKH